MNRPFWIVLLLLSAADVAAQQSASSPRAATASRISTLIHVDGHLDEPAWQTATSIGELVQSEPDEGSAPSESTDVRIAYDADALYIAVICRDRSPDGVVSTQLVRDADLDVDDRITIVIDPFFDHRNGFFFQVNPAGARTDGQVANNAEDLSRDWDGIWNAAARRASDGWQAEIVVPFKTLRFKPGQTVWGLNVERQIKRRNEIDRWAGARRNVWIGNLAQAGRLEGIHDINQGVGLDLRPYVSGGEENSSGQFSGGLDVFDNLTPNLNAAMTINTDFAETEADVRQVNLTRFPLFFPEKRAFFLEGTGVFDIASLASSDELRPFFTRRIGLLENDETGEAVTIPISAGGKMIGRVGDYNIGLIDVGTRTVPGHLESPQNLFALRVSRNLFAQSWIGGIVTSGNPSGLGGNTLIGADARFATSTFRGDKNLALDLFALRTDDAASGRRDVAGGFRIDYPNDRWDLSLNLKQIGDGFAPALGFVPRTGIRQGHIGIAFQPRPERWGIRQFFFELRPDFITNLQNRMENWRVFVAPFNVRTESGEHLEWNYIPEFERLDEPFEISPGVVLPLGEYQWTHFRAEANTATKRPWVVDAELSWGEFYNGTRRGFELGLTLKPTTHVLLSAHLERNDIELVQGSFVTDLVTVRADYNFSPDVSWTNLVQWDDTSRIAGVQSRFRWILEPGRDLFLVVNRGWYKPLDGPFERRFDRGSAKIQYTFRM